MPLKQNVPSCAVQLRGEFWQAGRADDTLPARHCSAPPRGPGCAPAAAGVEVRDGCQVSTTLGQQSIWRRVAAGSEAPVDNICHGGRTIWPWAWARGSALFSLATSRATQTWTCAEAGAKNTAKTQSELLTAG